MIILMKTTSMTLSTSIPGPLGSSGRLTPRRIYSQNDELASVRPGCLITPPVTGA